MPFMYLQYLSTTLDRKKLVENCWSQPLIFFIYSYFISSIVCMQYVLWPSDGVFLVRIL